MNSDKRRVVLFWSITAVFIAAVLVSIVFFIMSLGDSSDNPEVTISNYDSYVENMPNSERTAIQRSLYDTVAMNNEALDSAVTALIRENSYSQTFERNIYKTEYLVDIDSLQQTYRVSHSYSRSSPEESGLYDYAYLVLCPAGNELVYDPFTCQDRLSVENGVTESDPILQYLPVSTLNFNLELDPASDDIKIIAKINLAEVDYRLGADESAELYKAEIAQWFDDNDLDIELYDITYEY